MKNNSEYLNQLQFFRFICFVLIFIHHLECAITSSGVFENGAANSVDFFILLSGFLYGYLYYKKNIDCSIKSIKEFIINKIKKIYPLYFFTLLISISYSKLPFLIIKHYFVATIPLIIYLVRHLFLVQSWFSKGYFLFNSAGWFLSTILFLYLLTLPLLSLFGRVKKYKHSNLIYVFITLCSFLSIVLYCYITRNTNMEYTQYIFPISRIGEYICGISMGCLICNISTKLNVNKNNKVFFYTIIEIIALILWISNMFFSYKPWKFRIVHWVIPNLILISIFSIGKGYISKILKLPLMKYLGDISFECFLIHYVVISLYKSFFELGSITSCILCFVISITLSVLVHFYNTNKEGINMNKKKLFKQLFVIFSLVIGFIIFDLFFYNQVTRNYINKYGDSIKEKSIDLVTYLPFKSDSLIVHENSDIKIIDDIPVIDGATALYPVYSSFVEALYPEDSVKFENDDFTSDSKIQKSGTTKAYKRLVDGDVDIIIVAGPSEKQLEYAKNNNVELEMVPIGKESFVFIVNKNNNVNNLTIQNIKDIYSGKITNWSEVGGSNDSIIPLQRAEGSGSQTAMLSFMKDTDIISSRVQFFGKRIGYSFRYYIEGIVKDGNIKMLSINGVSPTKENIKNDTYPIVDNFYMIYRKDNDNKNIEIIKNFVLSDKGKYIIEETGYVSY